MIAEKIYSVVAAIGDLAGKVPNDAWEVLSCARRELRDAAEQAATMESDTPVDVLNGRHAQGCIADGGANG